MGSQDAPFIEEGCYIVLKLLLMILKGMKKALKEE